nr:YaiI/YqxD family protein [Paenibacillus senegalensis]
MTSVVKIIVDADACPVKNEIEYAARQFEIEAWMVASYDHRLVPREGIKTIQVDRSDQSADLYIANCIQASDILITQDYGLATIGLAKQAYVLSNRGHAYSPATIDFMLETRHDLAKQRRAGKHSKGPKAFTQQDRDRFLQSLTKLLENLQENGSR